MSFESVFCMKIVKSRLLKKYLKIKNSPARFCFSLGWLNISEKKLLNTAILSVLEHLKIFHCPSSKISLHYQTVIDQGLTALHQLFSWTLFWTL